MNFSPRPGMAPIVIAIVVVVVVAIAGVGTYLLVFSGSASSTGRVTVSSSSTLLSSSTLSSQASSSVQGYQNYKGTFSYTTPLGPFGISDVGGQVQEWNSTQSASGSFAFAVNPATYTGTGTGQGTITVSTHGYCTGSATVQYTFTIQVAYPPGENMTIAFNTPNPQDVMVQLNCKGSVQGFNQSNNPVKFLSVYPNGVFPGAFPATRSQPLKNGISYTVTVVLS